MEKEYNSFNFDEIDNIKTLPKGRNISRLLANQLMNNLTKEEKIDYINQEIEESIKNAEEILNDLNTINIEIKKNIILMETRKTDQFSNYQENFKIENNLLLLQENSNKVEIAIEEFKKDKDKIERYLNKKIDQEIEKILNKFNKIIEKHKSRINPYLDKK